MNRLNKKVRRLMNEVNNLLKTQEVISDKITYKKLDKVYWTLNEIDYSFVNVGVDKVL